MTKEKAIKTYKSWKEYIEIVKKFHKILDQVPESLLPYPADTLEEALNNIITKEYSDAGDKKVAEEAIGSMKNILFENPDLKMAILNNLRRSRANSEQSLA